MEEIWGQPVRGHSAVDVWHIKLRRVKKFLNGWPQNIAGHQRKKQKLVEGGLV